MALALAVVLGLAAGSPSVDLVLGNTVYNHSDIRGPVPVRAQLEVTEIFSELGVRVIWHNGATGRGDDQQAASELTLILLSKPLDGRADQAGELGLAPGHAAFKAWRREGLGFTPEQAELIRAA
jgi:hypothetical protein